jgi:hypothetical protein
MYRVLAIIACLLLIARPTRAAEPEKVVVLILPEAGPATSHVFPGFDTLRDQLQELAVHLFVESAARSLDLVQQVGRARGEAKQHGARGTVWFDESPPDKLSIYVYDAKHGTFAQRVLHTPVIEAGAAEMLAVVVRSAIDALLTGEEVRMELMLVPNAVPEQPPVLEQPVPRRNRLHVRFGVAYGGTSFAPGTWQNGGDFFVQLRPLKALYFGAAYTIFPTLTLEAFGAEALIVRHPVELALGLQGELFPRFDLAIEAAGLLDAVQRTTVLRDPQLTALPRDTRLRWGVSPRARAWWSVVGPLRAFAAGGADVLFADFDYVINTPGGQGRIVQRAIRPRVEAGIAVELP